MSSGTLVADMLQILNEADYDDLDIVVGDEKIAVHMALIDVRRPRVRTELLFVQPRPVRNTENERWRWDALGGIALPLVRAVVEWMYSGAFEGVWGPLRLNFARH